MDRRKLTDPNLHVMVKDCPHGEEAHLIRVYKTWWGGPGRGGNHRVLHEFCVPRADALEGERMARALEAAAAALRG